MLTCTAILPLKKLNVFYNKNIFIIIVVIIFSSPAKLKYHCFGKRWSAVEQSYRESNHTSFTFAVNSYLHLEN